MNLINLTPHTINLVVSNGKEVSVEPVGQIARCEQQFELVSHIDDIDIYSSSYGDVKGMMPKRKGTLYIVSSIVAQALQEFRNDLLVPCLYERDAEGRILRCRGLSYLK